MIGGIGNYIMNLNPPTISLGSQQLTPAKLQWIMDVGHSTVEDWLENKDVSHFKKGRLIRISPEEVTRFILCHTGRGRGFAPGYVQLTPSPQQWDSVWQRIERLVKEEIRGQMSAVRGENLAPTEPMIGSTGGYAGRKAA